MKSLLQEEFDLRDEIDRLEKGKVLRGKDKVVGMAKLFEIAPVDHMPVGLQTDGPEMSTVRLMTDISRMQVVCETTYASVASQACPEGSLAVRREDVEMEGVGGGTSGPPPIPVVADILVVHVPGVLQAYALLVHGVDCRRDMRALLGAAPRLRVGECTVRGVRWLLRAGRHWGKRLSSVVA